jgi:nicotinamide/nicotinate riboside kinase
MASDTDTDKDGAATAAAVIISISGPSSSGKTTISRLLRDLFPSMFILHQDDFYKPESE